jgi:hypothetical protein
MSPKRQLIQPKIAKIGCDFGHSSREWFGEEKSTVGGSEGNRLSGGENGLVFNIM